MSEPKWKRSIDYYAFKSIRLEREAIDLRYDVSRLEVAVDALTKRQPRKLANQFVVFKIDGHGNYHSPIIVDADSAEEALCPEGCEEPRGDFCHRLYAPSEYKDI